MAATKKKPATKTKAALTIAPDASLALLAQFGPVVRQVISETTTVDISDMLQIGVAFVEAVPEVHMQRFALTVTLDPSHVFNVQDVLELTQALERFTRWEPETGDEFRLGEYAFDLGDGDDWQAVEFKAGTFSIWVRGWVKA